MVAAEHQADARYTLLRRQFVPPPSRSLPSNEITERNICDFFFRGRSGEKHIAKSRVNWTKNNKVPHCAYRRFPGLPLKEA